MSEGELRTNIQLGLDLALVVFRKYNGRVDLRVRYGKGQPRWLTPVLPIPAESLLTLRQRLSGTYVKLEHPKIVSTLELTVEPGYLVIRWQEKEYKVFMQEFALAIQLPKPPKPVVPPEPPKPEKKPYDPDGSEFWEE